MANVNYSVVTRTNPLKKEEPAKFYAQIQAKDEYKFEDLASAVESRCSVTSSDVKAVMDAVMKEMSSQLKDGKIVRINDLGTFRISVTSKGVDTEKAFNASKISKVRILFRPCRELQSMCSSIKFSKLAIPGQSEGDDGDGGIVDDPTA
ncbi:HU family DNA-binding protein [Bacteroides fragilis]|uniref:HU family DNA-binding protein n=1 Tax=Bacteroides fragilis TaxID=817 RepID=UPI00202E911B|nr:HU family DNA-binding protein [Bacteroides fragilis]MCM0275912.1 HU family DNA-binding protein [Bacteroides fragilis]